MRCKIGDICFVLAAKHPACARNIGKIVEIVASGFGATPDGKPKANCWHAKGNLTGWDGFPKSMMAFSDEHLLPIRYQPGADETLTWAPVPGQKEEATCS